MSTKTEHDKIYRRPKLTADLDLIVAINDQMNLTLAMLVNSLEGSVMAEHDRRRMPKPKTLEEALLQFLEPAGTRESLVGFVLYPNCLADARAALRDTLSILDDLEREMLRGPT